MFLDWAGFGLCAIAIGFILYNTYWGLQALMCPSHLGVAFTSVFLPASTWEDDEAMSVRTWIHVRANFRRQVFAAAAVFALLYLWIVGPGSIGLLVLTVIITGGVVADARVTSLLRNDEEELEEYALARREIDRGIGLGQVTRAS